ncbi:hypothetical protein, partial [Fluoribacter dumoffii]
FLITKVRGEKMAWGVGLFFKDTKTSVKKTLSPSVKPDFYYTVEKLVNGLNSEKKEKHSAEITEALEQLEAKLNAATENFNRKYKEIRVFQYRGLVQEFANDCHYAICKYQTTLMAAPGICNKLKSYINSLFEYFACGKIFDIEFNKLGKDEDFRNKIENAKNDILNDYYSTASDEDDECSCLSGIFPSS